MIAGIHRAPNTGAASSTHSALPAVRMAGVLFLVCALSGCALLTRAMGGKSAQSLVSAAPLAISNPTADLKVALTTAQNATDDKTKQEFLGSIVMDSETKCQSFINGLVVAENTVNTAGDITSTVLTGLASVFKPLTTVHALTAGSTVVTGSKTSIDANIYAKASIVNFQTALQQSYSKSILAYTDSLPHLTGAIVSNEISKIQSIHATCTLAATEASILTTISPAGQVPAKPTGLAAQALNGGIKLTWTAVSGDTYSVFQGTASNAESATAVQTGITGGSFTVAPLPNDSATYFFQISAQNAIGSSPKSDEASAKPSASIATVAVASPPPPAPTTHGAISGADLRN